MNEALHIRIYGVVQGVGFRPFVSRLADRLGLTGSVANRGSYVEVHAQGTPDALEEFRAALEREAPPRSAILKVVARPEPPFDADRFAIIESEHEAGDIFVSPDIATCDLCRDELYDPRNRRYLHPFINCTACGPRVTILDAMPYDRVRTSMADFPMCPECEYEYTHPETRRYDAQPVCCNDCGPELYLLGDEATRGRAALDAARRTLIGGGIVAVKGLGGFHLACDARNPQAVERLRRLKRRPAKPFAVMMRDLDAVRRECGTTPAQEALLTGHQKPILLLKRRQDSTLADAVAPGNPSLGVMLPYAPVQMLLFRADDELDARMTDALVMTSGNLSGAPICRDDDGAHAEIASFCDLILSHNRLIRLRCDDSVMDFLEGRPYMIRRSRGYAPLPFLLSDDLPGQVLGIGAELKNTFCPAKDGLLYPSPYIGDMADLRSVNALRESIARLDALLEVRPALVACDLHPRYNTTAVARELGLPMLPLQHHYAHILSCMAENDWQGGELLGLACDGTGYGTDGSIWGGELLKCNWRGFTRLAAIAPFAQPGGDASAREGWRIAASMLHSLAPADAPALAAELGLCTPAEFAVIATMCDRRVNTVVSTSTGRLFDAVAALLGLRRASTFEGEAAMALQFAAENDDTADAPPLPDCDGGAIPTDALFRLILQGRRDGLPSTRLARLFHLGLADLLAGACRHWRDRTRLDTVALSGGVFQNTLLTRLLADRLRRDGFRVLLHSLVPPNDGGICLGQAAAALHHLNPGA